MFYLLLLGCGVGFRVLPDDVAKIPNIVSKEVVHKDLFPVPKRNRKEKTYIETYKDKLYITVGDSKESWTKALEIYLQSITTKDNVKTIIFDYDNIRKKGERIKTFGGYASGYQALKGMFEKIARVVSGKEKLSPIDCMDIANIIGENVCSGGVRRTSEICLFDINDSEIRNSKSNLYTQDKDGNWSVNGDIIHRQMSNNSIVFKKRPMRDFLNKMIDDMRYSGEPGFFNLEAALKRRSTCAGPNPCGEALLGNNGFCNLTTLNVYAFIVRGELDKYALFEAQKLSTRVGIRMTLPEIELPKWNESNKKERIIGCSLTGWHDMVNELKMTKEDEKNLLRWLREISHKEAEEYSKVLGIDKPILCTILKPEGTISQLPTVSSGVHYSHSEYYIRRVRINAADPLLKVCEELGYPIFPEVGQDMETATTKVIEFPIKSPKGRTKHDVTAIEQLENYKMFMENYTDHNTSITVSVRDNEWEQVKDWVWDNWDSVIGITFLPLNDSFYRLMPYEAIDKEEYEKRVKEMSPFIPSLISKYEKNYTELDIGTEGCESGVCPIR
jgi:ribonucleoside-diphosphate reductase alpha chain/ribonucleoside-triphosphate reductase